MMSRCLLSQAGRRGWARTQAESSVMPESKQCSQCGQIKVVRAFPRNSGRGDGYENRCKCCTDKGNADRAATHRQQLATFKVRHA